MLVIIKSKNYSNVVYFPKPQTQTIKKFSVQRYRLLWGNEVHFGFENMLWRNILGSE